MQKKFLYKKRILAWTLGLSMLFSAVPVQTAAASKAGEAEEAITTENWDIRLKNGSIHEMQTKIGEEMMSIPMRTDNHKLQWLWNEQPVGLTADSASQSDEAGKILSYTGAYQDNEADLSFTLQYQTDVDGNLVISAGMTNNGTEDLSPKSASLDLGFDTYLASYPTYESQLFPTLLRCEKTHLWGYFSSPSGKIMTIATDQPVASYTLHYQSGGHRIYGAALDLLHEGPLPERHPQNCDTIKAGETKQWKIYLKPAENIRAYDKIKETLAGTADFPIVDADRYTVSQGETSHLKIYSASPLTVKVSCPDGEVQTLFLKEAEIENIWLASFSPDQTGVYKLTVANESGYEAESMLTCRMPWSWYVKQARQAAIDAPQKGSTHIETYMGLYSGYLARKYFPDAQADLAIDENLNEIYPLMYDQETGLPRLEENRVQNHSGMMGILVDKYQASGDLDALERAEILAGHVISRQRADGGYYNNSEGVDYTSVIYPAKSIMELMYVERELMADTTLNEKEREKWKERYEAHFASVTRAMDNLVNRDGNLDTEGQVTFEDGANSCSYTQLAEFALFFEKGSEERKKYTDAAISYLGRHVSHQQILVPDSRTNGGTLRFWEAQYDVEMELTGEAPNMMNSPHGWTAWSIYGYFDLYELTGDEKYLHRGMNALGSCAQLMDFDGTLRWAFVGDPYRKTNLFIKNEEQFANGKVAGKHEAAVIGEQYVNMISTWWRAPKNTVVKGYTKMRKNYENQGAACDNDVHEIFKCISEVALTNAYVIEQEDGSFECYNCTAAADGSKLTIVPAEEVVSNVSVKLNAAKEVTVRFYNGNQTETVSSDELPVWISTKENCIDINQSDKNSSLSSLAVSRGTLTPAFDVNVTEYTLKLHPDAEEVSIIPAAAGTKAAVIYDGKAVESGKGIVVDTTGISVDQTILFRVASENLASFTTYRVRILKGSINENIAPSASKITASGATGSDSDPAALVDGKKDDNAAGTTLTLNTECPQEIQFSWDEPKNFNSVVLWAWYAKEQAPTNWEIHVTYDGTSWEKIAETGDISWKYSDATLESYTSEFDEVQNAVGLKLILKAGNTTWRHFAINEIEIMTKNFITDTSVLSDQLEAAYQYKKEDYEEEGWDAFIQKRNEAQNILSDSSADQEALDRALRELADAIGALKKKPEKISELDKTDSEPRYLEKGSIRLYQGIYYQVTEPGAVGVKKVEKRKKKIVIPAQIELEGMKYKVTSILGKAFWKDKKLTSITLGSHIISIGKKSFSQCSKLKTLQFKGKKAVNIAGKAFAKTSKKITVKVPKSMKAKVLKKLKSNLKKRGLFKKAVFKKVN